MLATNQSQRHIAFSQFALMHLKLNLRCSGGGGIAALGAPCPVQGRPIREVGGLMPDGLAELLASDDSDVAFDIDDTSVVEVTVPGTVSVVGWPGTVVAPCSGSTTFAAAAGVSLIFVHFGY